MGWGAVRENKAQEVARLGRIASEWRLLARSLWLSFAAQPTSSTTACSLRTCVSWMPLK